MVMVTRPKRPNDVIALSKLIGDIAIGQVQDVESRKIKATRESGAKGGASRAVKLTQEQRSEIASMAALARWKKAP
jgi:hypothetical protein